MIRPRAAAVLALALASPAPLAAQDARITERFYDPSGIVRIDGRTKVQATIQFAPDEQIENVAIGDSEAWQVTPNKRANLLFVKPLAPTATTNMTVVTDRRTYLFDLVASPKGRPVYVLRFTYPPEEAKPAAPLGAASAEEIAAAAAPESLAPDPAALNFAWRPEGDRKLWPARTYDDGSATFLAWPAGSPMPAILAKDAQGTEGPVNFTVREGVVVVDGVPRELVLRSGRQMAVLVNSAPPAPKPTAELPAPAQPTPQSTPAPAALAISQGAR